jgi:transposase InsO family protein
MNVPIPSNIPARITAKKEFKGTSQHVFVKACTDLGIGQKFTRIKRPQTNGKAERVIRTLMDMWHTGNLQRSKKPPSQPVAFYQRLQYSQAPQRH